MRWPVGQENVDCFVEPPDKVAALLPGTWLRAQGRFEMAASGGFWQKTPSEASQNGGVLDAG
jgi:hypothetical protein